MSTDWERSGKLQRAAHVFGIPFRFFGRPVVIPNDVQKKLNSKERAECAGLSRDIVDDEREDLVMYVDVRADPNVKVEQQAGVSRRLRNVWLIETKNKIK